MLELRTYQIIRTELDSGQSFVHRTLNCGERGLDGVKGYCKRLNAFNTLNDFPSFYSWREKPDESMVSGK